MLLLVVSISVTAKNSAFAADTTPPTVVSTTPGEGAKNASTNTVVRVTFSESMDSATINSSTFLVNDGTGNISGSVSYDSHNNQASFQPAAALTNNATYTVTVKGGTNGVKDLAGNAMSADYTWTFTVDETAPTAPTLTVRQVTDGQGNVMSYQLKLTMFGSTDNVGIAGYKIYRSTDNVNFSKVSTASNTTFIDDGLQANTTYYYKVQAYDSAGNTSVFSNTDSATTGAKRAFTRSTNPAVEGPHGLYMENTDVCASCHSSHAATGSDLLTQTTITGVCYTCHDGTGSNYNVQALFDSNSGNVSFHPVKDTGNLGINGAIECASCHNPHGDEDPNNPGNLYPKLLRASDGGNYYYKGKEFCLSCHGINDRNFTGPTDTYWEDTLGDHSNINAAHYDETKTVLQPASGTQITCVKCHDKHAAPNEQLLLAIGDTLCYNCHDDAANSLSGRDIKAEYQRPGSTHSLTGSAPEVVLGCTNCHGPHAVGSVSLGQGLSYSDLSDPDNTKNVFTQDGTATGNVTIGNITDFCLKCHDGAPPTEVADVNSFVPNSVVFPSKDITTNAGGWNKAATYGSSGHGAASIKCTQCHDEHGANYASLVNQAEDTETADNRCNSCHNGSYPGVIDVKPDFTTKAYTHPTLTTSGKHSNDENYNNMPAADRHAECVDCHDPHAANDTPVNAPMASGYVRNVSGVQVNTDPAVRPAWTILPPDSPGYIFVKAITNEYELCYKCHSSFSYGSTPPPGQTDVARDFNPNNPSYHPIEAVGKNEYNDNGRDYSASLVNGWAPDSMMTCTDCHGSENPASPRNVHGSNNKNILKAPYTEDTGRAGYDTSNHLCFQCHDYTTYRGGDKRTDNNTGFTNDKKENLHLVGDHKNAGCMDCHGMTPHGGPRPHLIAIQSDGPPFASPASKLTAYVPNSGNYTKEDCSATHTGDH